MYNERNSVTSEHKTTPEKSSKRYSQYIYKSINLS